MQVFVDQMAEHSSILQRFLLLVQPLGLPYSTQYSNIGKERNNYSMKVLIFLHTSPCVFRLRGYDGTLGLVEVVVVNEWQ